MISIKQEPHYSKMTRNYYIDTYRCQEFWLFLRKFE